MDSSSDDDPDSFAFLSLRSLWYALRVLLLKLEDGSQVDSSYEYPRHFTRYLYLPSLLFRCPSIFSISYSPDLSGVGNGQAAKICNNMMLGVQMISTAEAYNLAKKLGLAPTEFASIVNVSSGRCWSSENGSAKMHHTIIVDK